MVKMIPQLFGQRHRPEIVGIPTGIQTAGTTFQNQPGTADIGQPSSALILSGVDLYFYSAPVTGIRRGSRHQFLSL
jgi:hypothetical protein